MFEPSFSVEKLIWPAECYQLEQIIPQNQQNIVVAIERELQINRNVIGFGSDKSGSGCTIITLFVARTLAQMGKSVLILDARFSRPQLAQKLRLAPEFDWSEVANRMIPLEDAVIESVGDKIHVAPLKEPVSRPELLDMTSMIRKLKISYDVILVDLGTEPTDKIWWIESAILVRDTRAVNQPVSSLNLPNLRIIGQIENFV